MICGYRIEKIENPLTRQARYLDKLVDELAKGKKWKIFQEQIKTKNIFRILLATPD